MRARSITAKIWLSIGVFVAGFVASTVLGQIAGRNMENKLENAANALFPAAQRSQQAESAFEQVVKGFGDAVIVQDESGLQRASDQGSRVVEDLSALAQIAGQPAENRESASRLSSEVRQFLTEANSLYRTLLASPSSMNADMQERMKGIASRTAALQQALHDARELNSKALQSHLATLRNESAGQRWWSLAVFLVTLALATVIVNVTIRRSITAPILRVIDGVQTAVGNAAATSEQMVQSGELVARDARDQAICIRETSSSLEEISNTTTQNAGRAREADELMKEAQRTVERASQAMNDLKLSMGVISTSSRQASQVLKSIDEIAFHTNILALNAAVEAARAGSAGAGFSVVADEVRNLAMRAAEAARHSTEIIEKTIVDVRQGEALVSVAHVAFGDVSASISSGSQVVADIAHASEEQAVGVKHVGETIHRIELTTQKSVVGAQKTAEAATDMLEQVEGTRRHLEELVAVVGLRNRRI